MGDFETDFPKERLLHLSTTGNNLSGGETAPPPKGPGLVTPDFHPIVLSDPSVSLVRHQAGYSHSSLSQLLIQTRKPLRTFEVSGHHMLSTTTFRIFFGI